MGWVRVGLNWFGLDWIGVDGESGCNESLDMQMRMIVRDVWSVMDASGLAIDSLASGQSNKQHERSNGSTCVLVDRIHTLY